jgi:hypothetical protein
MEKNALKRINQLADKQTARDLAGETFPLSLKPDLTDSMIVDFLGVEYEIVKSDISGGDWVQYGKKSVTFQIPLFNKSIVADSVKLPYAYLIPKEWQAQIMKLKLHGVDIKYLSKDTTLLVESYRFNNVSWQEESYEGHHLVSFDQEVISEKRNYPAGTAVIFMNQRTNRLIANLLEPKAPDSFLRWGFWDTIFERKEYGEDYVLEEVAREMLVDNPELRSEFNKRVAEDEDFSNDHWARLFFFYQRTPYWDPKLNVYPVGRLMNDVKLLIKED